MNGGRSAMRCTEDVGTGNGVGGRDLLFLRSTKSCACGFLIAEWFVGFFVWHFFAWMGWLCFSLRGRVFFLLLMLGACGWVSLGGYTFSEGGIFCGFRA